MSPLRRRAARPADGAAVGRRGLVARLSGPVRSSRAHTRAPAYIAREPFHRTDGQPDSPSPTGLAKLARGLRTLVRGGRKLGFRHRRTLAPLWVLVALALLPTIGRALGFGARVPLVGGAALTFAGCCWADRGRGRWYAFVVGAAATIWSWVAWAFVTRWLLLPLVALWLPAAVLWWRYQHVRARIGIAERAVRLLPVGEWWAAQVRRRDLGGSLGELRATWPGQARAWWSEMSYRRRSRRALRRIWEGWRRTASAAEVPGCRIRRATADRVAYTLHVNLRRGQTHRRMLAHLDELGSALGATVGTLRIETEQRMDRVRIRWVHHDPLAGPGIPWPFAERPEVESIEEPFSLGPNEHGEAVKVRLADGVDTVLVGIKDSGKSGVLNVMIAAVAGMRDAVLWGIDPAGEVEFGPWGSVFDRLAGDDRSTAALLGAVERLVQVRLAKLRRAGARSWEPRLGPYLVLFIDELAQLRPALRARLARIVQLCRKCGIRIVAATQHPSVEETGSSLRSQLDRIICLRLKSEAVRLVFDADDRAAGWDPARLTAAGSFLIKSRQHQEPLVARAYWLDDATVAAVAERLGALRPALDPESAAAEVGEGALEELARPTVLELVANPEEPAAEREERLRALRGALRGESAPVSGRQAARLAGLPKSWVAEVGLPELRALGEVEQTAGGEWRWVDKPGAGEVPG